MESPYRQVVDQGHGKEEGYCHSVGMVGIVGAQGSLDTWWYSRPD